jgi:(E)-4-hydroxy-3-methylbut-2-enyl-diphosphate synthase
VEKTTRHIQEDIKIAVMGCVVNGPGEAQDADIALCGGDGSSALYLKGNYVKTVKGDPREELLKLIDVYLADQKGND